MRSVMRRATLPALVVGLALVAADTARAIVTDYTIDGDPAVLLGQRRTFRATFADPAVQISSFKWEYQGVSDDFTVVGGWVDTQVNSSVMSMNMAYVDKVQIRLTVTYAAPMGQPQLNPTVKVHTVTVLRPDSDVVIQGFNTPTDSMTFLVHYCTVKFEMRAGGTPIGGSFVGYVQEFLSHKRVWDTINLVWQWVVKPDDTEWTPVAGETSSLFTRNGNLIVDQKSFPVPSAAWAQIPVGHDLTQMTQQNRLVAKNWLSQDVTIPFPAHYFRRQKADDTNWILLEDTQPWQ
jgi:hypothetical protein